MRRHHKQWFFAFSAIKPDHIAFTVDMNIRQAEFRETRGEVTPALSLFERRGGDFADADQFGGEGGLGRGNEIEGGVLPPVTEEGGGELYPVLLDEVKKPPLQGF